jgi:hypothetical protein
MANIVIIKNNKGVDFYSGKIAVRSGKNELTQSDYDIARSFKSFKEKVANSIYKIEESKKVAELKLEKEESDKDEKPKRKGSKR